MRLFGTSGIRGIVTEDLIRLAFRVGLAVGSDCGRVVVGRDTRTSGDAMKHALVSGLLAAGSECHDAGIVPTPTLALAAARFDAGAMITASHNPPQYNGLKLLNPDGSSFISSQQQQLETAISGGSFNIASWDKMTASRKYDGAVEEHIARIRRDFPSPLKLKVVLDCGCGAASVITPGLLRGLGCEVLALDCYPSGRFPRDVEPTESNLGNLMRAVREYGAGLGLAHDGDADRMMAVDDRGRFIPGDKLLAVLARTVAAKEVVTTIDASMAVDELGFNVKRTPVGDTAVSEELRNGGDFGAEPSGSWVFPGVSLCPDGIYAAAVLASVASQQRLSALVDGIPSYPLRRGSVSGDGVAAEVLESSLMALGPLSASDIDGIRLDFGDGWLLVRPSGTEPKIRLTAEARDEARAGELYEAGMKAVKTSINSEEMAD
ncbi:MAG: phosphoglucosamine mutase [Chloroflexota bacterium]